MAGEVLHIKHLRLRIPGLSGEEARGLGDEVAHLVADGLPTGAMPQQLGTLDLRVMLPAGTERDRLATLIAEAVLGRLA
jgi:hypothetical protein